jgi:polyhydroxyalkanoate synthesis regulator protein
VNLSKAKRKFVKYRNRKLHEEGSQTPYVSMRDLAAVVLSGDEVQIIDDETGKDLTLATLGRILYDLCRGDDAVVSVEAVRDVLRSAKLRSAGRAA